MARFNRSARKYISTFDALEDRLLLYSELGGHFTYGARITYSIVPDGTSIGGGVYSNLHATMPAGFETAIQKAAAVWEASAGVQFVEVADSGVALGTAGAQQGDTKYGDIRIFGMTQDDNTLACILAPPPFWGGPSSSDMFFNTNLANWHTDGTTRDVETVAIHEFGHTLGLGHSDPANPVQTYPYACMYYAYNATKQTLTTDDINGVQAIWGAPASDTFNAGTSSGNAKDITSYISSDQINISDLALPLSTSAEWFKVVAPSSTTMTVRAQSSSLSSLIPQVVTYDNNVANAVTGTGTSYGDVATSSRSVTSGYTYYIKVLPGTAGTGNIGAYGLRVSFAPIANFRLAPLAESSTLFDEVGLAQNGSMFESKYDASAAVTYWYDQGAPSGTTFRSSPAATYISGGSLWIIGVGNDGNLYYGSGGSYTSLGKPASTTIAGYPSVALKPGGVGVNIYVTGADGHVWTKATGDNSTWNSWVDLGNGGGTISGCPTASWIGSSFVDVFANRTDGTLEEFYWDGSWHSGNLGNAGANTQGNPSMAINGSDKLVVVVAANGTLDTYYYNGSWSTGNRSNGGSSLVNDATVIYAGSAWEVYAEDGSGNHYEAYSSNGTSYSWGTLASPSVKLVGTPAAIGSGSHRAIASIGNDGQMYFDYCDGSNWTQAINMRAPTSLLGRNGLVIPNTYVASTSDDGQGTIQDVAHTTYDAAIEAFEAEPFGVTAFAKRRDSKPSKALSHNVG